MTASDEDYWFKPRRYGYGARPANAKGWAASAAYLLAILALFWVFPVPNAQTAPAIDVALWFCAVDPITLPFVWLARVKTKGEWRWRWGERE
jgi:hypothetical protein